MEVIREDPTLKDPPNPGGGQRNMPQPGFVDLTGIERLNCLALCQMLEDLLAERTETEVTQELEKQGGLIHICLMLLEMQGDVVEEKKLRLGRLHLLIPPVVGGLDTGRIKHHVATTGQTKHHGGPVNLICHPGISAPLQPLTHSHPLLHPFHIRAVRRRLLALINPQAEALARMLPLPTIGEAQAPQEHYHHLGMLPMHDRAILQAIGHLKSKTELVDIPAPPILDQWTRTGKERVGALWSRQWLIGEIVFLENPIHLHQDSATDPVFLAGTIQAGPTTLEHRMTTLLHVEIRVNQCQRGVADCATNMLLRVEHTQIDRKRV